MMCTPCSYVRLQAEQGAESAVFKLPGMLRSQENERHHILLFEIILATLLQPKYTLLQPKYA